MNQQTAIIKYLRRNRGITTWTAMEIGVARLSERIRELEAKGYKFQRERLRGEGRYGNPVHVTKYRMVSEPR